MLEQHDVVRAHESVDDLVESSGDPEIGVDPDVQVVSRDENVRKDLILLGVSVRIVRNVSDGTHPPGFRDPGLIREADIIDVIVDPFRFLEDALLPDQRRIDDDFTVAFGLKKRGPVPWEATFPSPGRIRRCHIGVPLHGIGFRTLDYRIFSENAKGPGSGPARNRNRAGFIL